MDVWTGHRAVESSQGSKEVHRELSSLGGHDVAGSAYSLSLGLQAVVGYPGSVRLRAGTLPCAACIPGALEHDTARAYDPSPYARCNAELAQDKSGHHCSGKFGADSGILVASVPFDPAPVHRRVQRGRHLTATLPAKVRGQSNPLRRRGVGRGARGKI